MRWSRQASNEARLRFKTFMTHILTDYRSQNEPRVTKTLWKLETQTGETHTLTLTLSVSRNRTTQKHRYAIGHSIFSPPRLIEEFPTHTHTHLLFLEVVSRGKYLSNTYFFTILCTALWRKRPDRSQLPPGVPHDRRASLRYVRSRLEAERTPSSTHMSRLLWFLRRWRNDPPASGTTAVRARTPETSVPPGK